jgi:hypothetical protein
VPNGQTRNTASIPVRVRFGEVAPDDVDAVRQTGGTGVAGQGADGDIQQPVNDVPGDLAGRPGYQMANVLFHGDPFWSCMPTLKRQEKLRSSSHLMLSSVTNRSRAATL